MFLSGWVNAPLPQDACLITAQSSVGRDDRHLLDDRLAEDDAVERISVETWQHLKLLEVKGENRDQFYAGFFDLLEQIVHALARDAHLSACYLDGRFPERGHAEVQFIRRVVQGCYCSRRQAVFFQERPEDCVGIEKELHSVGGSGKMAEFSKRSSISLLVFGESQSSANHISPFPAPRRRFSAEAVLRQTCPLRDEAQACRACRSRPLPRYLQRR